MGAVVKLDPAKQRASVKDLVSKYLKASDMALTVRKHPDPAVPYPDLLMIDLYGEAARVPSLKNSVRFAGAAFLSADCRARLQVLDILWNRQSEKVRPFEDVKVHLLLINGCRPNRFDDDNCLACVKDWLEPASRPKGGSRKNRGWGIGLVQDDSQIKGYSLHASETGVLQTHTTIIIRPWETMREAVCSFVARHYWMESES